MAGIRTGSPTVTVSRRARRVLKKSGTAIVTVDAEVVMSCLARRDVSVHPGPPQSFEDFSSVEGDGIQVYYRHGVRLSGDIGVVRASHPASIDVDARRGRLEADVRLA